MTRSVHRSAGSGQFVSASTAAAAPGTTMRERVGDGTANRRLVYRDTGTGRFVTKDRNDADPGHTVAQRV